MPPSFEHLPFEVISILSGFLCHPGDLFATRSINRHMIVHMSRIFFFGDMKEFWNVYRSGNPDEARDFLTRKSNEWLIPRVTQF